MPKQLLECTTLSVSVHRVKSPVRACGYINPKGFARGGRTIAGTLILTQFTCDVLYRFLQAVLPNDLSKDTLYVKVDQLPPFNLTMLFADEYGNQSQRRILGMEFVTDGTVYSINDLLSEQTISFMAADFTPLLPLNENPVFNPDISGVNSFTTRQAYQSERTVSDIINRGTPCQPPTCVPAPENVFTDAPAHFR